MSDSVTPIDETVTQVATDRHRGSVVLTLGAGGALVALTLAITLGWRHALDDGSVTATALVALVALQVVAGAVFLAMLIGWRIGAPRAATVGRGAVIAMLVIGAAMRLATVPTSPRLEDDHFRYLYDGAVVGIGESPYRWSPSAASSAAPGIGDALAELTVAGSTTVERINHPRLRTIYPPVAQFWFALAQWLTPWEVGGWRLVLLLHDLATLALLWRLLRRLRLPALLTGIWWINPLVVGEIHQTLHMDVLIVPWVLGAIAFAITMRRPAASALLAVGVAIKLWPVILLPLVARGTVGSVWRDEARRTVVSVTVFTIVATALLAPMLLGEWAAGQAMESSTAPAESGLIRYAEAWENNAGFFALHHAAWERLLPNIGVEAWRSQQWTRVATIVLMAIVVAASLWRRIADPRDLARRAMWIVAALFVLGPTQFPWYFLWVVPLLAIGVDRHGRTCAPLVAFSALLPLYHLQELAPWTLWLQHLPVWAWLAVDALRSVREEARRHATESVAAVASAPSDAAISGLELSR